MIAMKTCLMILLACVLGALAKTECEENRDREQPTDAVIKFVPKCDENGDYETQQCFEDTTFCMCLRPNGSFITKPSCSLKTCDCHSRRDNIILQGIRPGTYLPQCEDDGTYSQRQCSGSTGMCWCVDEAGNRISEQSRGLKSCTCFAHKNSALKQTNGTAGNFVPNCEEDGSYSKIQCHGSTGLCWCVDENGNRNTEPTRILHSCECHNERHKQLELLKQGIVGQFVPTCETDGSFSERQCHASTGYCWCSNEQGERISEQSRNLKSCKCYSHRYREEQRSKTGIVGNFIPSCEDDGTYSSKQCSGSTGMCWCADEEGRQISEMTRDPIEC